MNEESKSTRKRKAVQNPVAVPEATIKKLCRLRRLYDMPDDHPGVLAKRADYVRSIKSDLGKVPGSKEELDELLSTMDREAVARWT